jgi:succinoglycan biosynthesis protein ExoA
MDIEPGLTTAPAYTATGEDVLIVIPSLNEQAHIESVIETLQADTACAKALIVVADGGSRDQTIAIVKRMGTQDPRVVAMETDRPLGISASVNRAVERFGHGRRWLVRIDAHAEYPPNYPSRLVRVAVERKATSVVTPMASRGVSCFQQASAAAQNSFLGTGGSAHRMVGRASGWVEHGHHALMAIDMFTAVGGYDETFSHNEDAELDHRILKAGGGVWLEPDLALVYYPRGTPRSLARQYFKYGRGRAMTVARHPGRRRLRQVLPLAIAPAICLLLFSPLFWPAAVPALLWGSICLIYGALLFRPGVPCVAMAGVAGIIMQACWSFGYWTQVLRGPRPGAPPSPLVLQG